MYNFGVKDWLWNGEGVNSHIYFHLISFLLTLSPKNLQPVIFQCYVFLAKELFFSHCFYYRVKNKCSSRSVRICFRTLTNEVFLTNNYFTSYITIFKLSVIRHILPSFENKKKYMSLSFTLFWNWRKVEKVVEVRTFTVHSRYMSFSSQSKV